MAENQYIIQKKKMLYIVGIYIINILRVDIINSIKWFDENDCALYFCWRVGEYKRSAVNKLLLLMIESWLLLVRMCYGNSPRKYPLLKYYYYTY